MNTITLYQNNNVVSPLINDKGGIRTHYWITACVLNIFAYLGLYTLGAITIHTQTKTWYLNAADAVCWLKSKQLSHEQQHSLQEALKTKSVHSTVLKILNEICNSIVPMPSAKPILSEVVQSNTLPITFPMKYKAEEKDAPIKISTEEVQSYLDQLWYKLQNNIEIPTYLHPMKEMSPFFSRERKGIHHLRSAQERRILSHILEYHPNRDDEIVYVGIGSSLLLQDWIILARLCLLGYRRFKVHLSDQYDRIQKDLQNWYKALQVFHRTLFELGAILEVTVHKVITAESMEEYPNNITILTAIAIQREHIPNTEKILTKLEPNGHFYLSDVRTREVSAFNKQGIQQSFSFFTWSDERILCKLDRRDWNSEWEKRFPGVKRVALIGDQVIPFSHALDFSSKS